MKTTQSASLPACLGRSPDGCAARTDAPQTALPFAKHLPCPCIRSVGGWLVRVLALTEPPDHQTTQLPLYGRVRSEAIVSALRARCFRWGPQHGKGRQEHHRPPVRPPASLSSRLVRDPIVRFPRSHLQPFRPRREDPMEFFFPEDVINDFVPRTVGALAHSVEVCLSWLREQLCPPFVTQMNHADEDLRAAPDLVVQNLQKLFVRCPGKGLNPILRQEGIDSPRNIVRL